MDQEWLIRFVESRVGDRRIVRDPQVAQGGLTLGRKRASPSDTQGGSRMRQNPARTDLCGGAQQGASLPRIKRKHVLHRGGGNET